MKGIKKVEVQADSGLVFLTKLVVAANDDVDSYCLGCDVKKLLINGVQVDCPRLSNNNLACVVDGSFENFILKVVGLK